MAEKKNINFVVTDLDDTLWDWLRMWYNSFDPFLRRISSELKINIEELKRNFKSLHQKYHTTEASPFLEDLPGLTTQQIDEIRHSNNNEVRSIIHEYNSNKKNNLFLYDGVLKTLSDIKKNGSYIIGYTESNSFFTKYRIKHFNLDGFLNRVYAPSDTGMPINMQRIYEDSYWEPHLTEFFYLPEKFKKPNSEILDTIFSDFGAKKASSIYIGDKLDRDIYMAQQAKVTSVYAKYGHNIESFDYNLLRDVTHWSAEDVQREQDFKASYHANPKPDYILESSFGELLNYFNFNSFNNEH